MSYEKDARKTANPADRSYRVRGWTAVGGAGSRGLLGAVPGATARLPGAAGGAAYRGCAGRCSPARVPGPGPGRGAHGLLPGALHGL